MSELMRPDGGTSGQPTSLVPPGGLGPAPGGRDEPPRRPTYVERGGLRIQMPATATRPTPTGESVELNFPDTDIREFARAVIGDILGLSPRTVNKHLEHVYVKLGVETRTAAAAIAMSALTR